MSQSNPNSPIPTQSTTGKAADKKAPIGPGSVKPGMKVLCSEDSQFGIVDRMEGNASLKLNKDDKGVHHYIPLAWVTRVDESVHVDRPGAQAMREWTTEAKKN